MSHYCALGVAEGAGIGSAASRWSAEDAATQGEP